MFWLDTIAVIPGVLLLKNYFLSCRAVVHVIVLFLVTVCKAQASAHLQLPALTLPAASQAASPLLSVTAFPLPTKWMIISR